MQNNPVIPIFDMAADVLTDLVNVTDDECYAPFPGSG